MLSLQVAKTITLKIKTNDFNLLLNIAATHTAWMLYSRAALWVTGIAISSPWESGATQGCPDESKERGRAEKCYTAQPGESSQSNGAGECQGTKRQSPRPSHKSEVSQMPLLHEASPQSTAPNRRVSQKITSSPRGTQGKLPVSNLAAEQEQKVTLLRLHSSKSIFMFIFSPSHTK